MNLQPHQYLFIILLAIGITASGSTPPGFSITEKSEVAFRYRPGNGDHLNNYFVKEIARYNFLNLYTTEYTLDFELQVKLSENDRGEFIMQAGLIDPNLKGDIFYKAFDLSGVLLPSTFDFNLVIAGENYPLILDFYGLQLNRENVVELDKNTIPDFGYQEISVTNIAFGYDDTDRINFEERIAEINWYLAFYEMLDFNLEKAQTIHPETRDSILPVFVRIYDIERFNNLLSRIEPDFPVPQQYDEKLKANRKKLAAHQRRIQTLFTRNLDTLNPVLSRARLELAANALIRLQKDYLTAMRNTNHLYEPAYLNVVDFFGDTSGWNELSAKLVDEFMPKAQTNDSIETIKNFASVLYHSYVSACDTLVANENFMEAGLFAGHAKTFCDMIPESDCDIATFNRLSQTRYGIFDAYLRVAQTAMENRNLPYSLQYLNLALEFQMKNSRFIISTVAVDRVFEQLAWEYLDQAEQMFDNDDFAGAFEHYTMSLEIYNEIAIPNYLDLIEKQIDRCVYEIDAEVENYE